MPETSSGNRESTVIRTPDQQLRVFVKFILKELTEERATMRQAIVNLRLTSILFELSSWPHPTLGLKAACHPLSKIISAMRFLPEGR